MQVFAIREARKHPWVLSTSRHLSQGGVSLVDEMWDAETATLSGTSKVVVGDPYSLTVYLPTGFAFESAEVDGEKAEITHDQDITTLRIVPATTKTVTWNVRFKK